MTEPDGPLGFEGQPEPPPGDRTRTPLIAGAALLVAVLLGVGIGVLVSGDDEQPRQEALSEEASPTPTPEGVVSEDPSPSASASASAASSASPSASATASASTSAIASATASARVTVTPSPTATAGPGPSTVSVTLSLDRTTVPVGGIVTATVQVRNERRDTVKVYSDCATDGELAVVRGQLASGPDGPTALTGTLRAFRDRAAADVPPSFRFDGGATCASGDPVPYVLGPSLVATQKVTWTARSLNGSRYDGPVTVTVPLRYSTAEQPRTQVPLTVPARTVRLTGGDAARLTATQAVDKALSDPDFAALVTSSDQAAWPRPGGTGYVELVGASGREEFVVSVTQSATARTTSGFSVTVSPTQGTVGDPMPFTRPSGR